MIERLCHRWLTVFRLGLRNVATVFLYRFAIRCRLIEKRMPRGAGYDEPLFQSSSVIDNPPLKVPAPSAVIHLAEDLLAGRTSHFSFHKINSASPPAWFQNPWNGRRVSGPLLHWSRFGEFDSDVGDIKLVWEASRFDWALLLARAFRLSGDPRFLEGLNDWASDWTMKNPLNVGPNWKCGQEAGIRMLQVLLAAFLLYQHDAPAPGLVRFVSEHCSRIEPTIRYAMAQDNNHGTSEAAALFVGGSWLEKVSNDDVPRRRAQGWKVKGRRWLENRASRLIGTDGSFSQNSLNYHRVLVDTLNMVEFWRRELRQEPFSDLFYLRSRAAIEWLYQMVDPVTGDAPNLGANDGARLFLLSGTDYRDYRPSVQLGAVLFFFGKMYPSGPCDEPLEWLGLDDGAMGQVNVARESRRFPEGGYAVFHPSPSTPSDSWGLVRFPSYRFRPSHADGLHFDLWHRGINVLRDSGSFSYNTDEPWQSYFYSTKAHNTIEFDGRDQMPRLGRFLFGAWLRMDQPDSLGMESGLLKWRGSYKDYEGCRHQRTISHSDGLWRVRDEIDGFKSCAVLRWRLAPGRWEMKGSRCVGELAELSIECSRPIKRVELVEGWESRYYFQKSKLPVLEVVVESGGAVLTTEIRLK